MDECWVVVADGARVRLFRKSGGQALEEFESLLNPEMRLREQDLVSDDSGHGVNRSRAGRFALEETESQREHAEKAMAAELAQRLRAARLEGRLKRLHVLAAPRFLGHLRQALDEATRDLIQSETAKDVSRLDAEEIRARLPEYL